MDVNYQKIIPYPFERVLAQYFDLEHIETVHPKTLGEYRILEVSGNRIIFQQRWPTWIGFRVCSVVEQIWVPPDRIKFRFVKGFLRGVALSSQLVDCNQETVIDEIYHVPLIPDWSWFRNLLRPLIVRAITNVWNEDLAVELCHGGWPGVPSHAAEDFQSNDSCESGSNRAVIQRCWVRVAEQEEIGEGCSHRTNVRGKDIVLWKHKGQIYALENRCSHAGGPLSLGHLNEEVVVCPWHSAHFKLHDGLPCGEPAETGVEAYRVRFSGKGVLVEVPI